MTNDQISGSREAAVVVASELVVREDEETAERVVAELYELDPDDEELEEIMLRNEIRGE